MIDVNGWSFVKGNTDYYDRSAKIIAEIFLKEIKRHGPPLIKKSITDNQHWRLKTFISVLRHGDRTPKQKIKYFFDCKPLLDLVKDVTTDEIILKTPAEIAVVRKAILKAIEENLGDIVSLQQIDHILDSKRDLDGTKIQLRPVLDKNTKMLIKMQSF